MQMKMTYYRSQDPAAYGMQQSLPLAEAQKWTISLRANSRCSRYTKADVDGFLDAKAQFEIAQPRSLFTSRQGGIFVFDDFLKYIM